MIKGKWRIDLGGKIKGAKSVALGSAVTKRGQDNSLQMCERCKYQVGGGEAARQARGPGRGLVRPPGGLETPGRLPIRAGPSPGAVRERGARGVGEPQVPNRGSASGAQLREPGADLHVPLPPRVDLRSRVHIPSASVGAPRAQGLSRCSRARQLPPQSGLLGPQPRRPGSRPLGPPRARRAAGGGVSLRGGSLWRCCVRRSLCRGAGSRGNANEANPGRRAEAPGGDGREGARAR